jgi:hypothetical protein
MDTDHGPAGDLTDSIPSRNAVIPPRGGPKLRSAEPPLPSVGTMASNALHAALRAAGAAVAGEPVLASPEVQAARLGVCRDAAGLAPDQTVDGHCDRWRPSDARCSECGCYTNLARKLATKDCPLSRWPK